MGNIAYIKVVSLIPISSRFLEFSGAGRFYLIILPVLSGCGSGEFRLGLVNNIWGIPGVRIMPFGIIKD